MGPVPDSEELPVTKSTENLTLATTPLILMKIMDSKKGEKVDFDPKFEASCSPSEPHLLTQKEILMILTFMGP
jgi:hypothetical protein